MIFGGDEWWFYGPRIAPGDQITVERRHVGYRTVETRFAGPTVLSWGDGTHVNQRGERISTQRSTAVRYLAEEARRRGVFGGQTPAPPSWSAADRAEWKERRLAWIRSGARQRALRWSEVATGTRLAQCVIGPHTVQTFTTEWRAFNSVVWGSVRDLWSDFSGLDAGWLPEMTRDFDNAVDDPALLDGLYAGASRGHTDGDAADLVGLPRGYGYGAAMGAWALNWAAHWAGDDGAVRHAAFQYRFPPFEGDVTLIDGEVVDKRHDSDLGVPIIVVDMTMTNQDGSVLAKGPLEVELPR